MKNRAVRIALVLLVVFAFAGAGYELAVLERRAAGSRDAAAAFEEKARQVEANLHELRAAQFAYVATGQGAAFWTGRGTTVLGTIARQLHELDSLRSAAAAAGVSASAAPAALDDLATVQRIDTGVQAYLRDGQTLLASDLVFADLREADQVLAAHVEDVRRDMAAAQVAAADQTRKAEIATAGGAAVFALLVLVLLAPAGSGARGGAEVQPAPAPARSPASPVEPKPSNAVRETPAASIDLSEAANLCTDLARVRETSQVQALLERAARLLDAVGVIIWLHDPASGTLRPALAAGYAPEALSRVPPVRPEDDNATARAYRDAALRVVGEQPLGDGAIAAPLMGADGVLGVMAAEIRRGGEARADVQAAAAIIAAQLATLVAPAPAVGDAVQK